MVNDRAVERRGKRSQFTGFLTVAGFEPCSLPAVGEEQPGTLMSHGVGEDLVGGKGLATLVASVA